MSQLPDLDVSLADFDLGQFDLSIEELEERIQFSDDDVVLPMSNEGGCGSCGVACCACEVNWNT